jgi:hypothetical protein
VKSILYFFVILAAAVVSTVEGQSVRGSIVGVVTDASLKPLGGARVELVNQDTGRQQAVSSNGAGAFLFTQMPAGAYRLEVTRDGFRKQIHPLVLLVNQEVRLDVALVSGARTESVEVQAAREVLKTETASLGVVVENRQIRNLPLDGRNFYELSLLAPGTAPSAQGSVSAGRSV